MMQFDKTQIQAAADDVARFTGIDVIYNENNILVISETSQGLNEFELRLAARDQHWDNESVDGVALLDSIINIQGQRTEFRPRTTTDEWQARYDIVAK